MQLNLKVNEDLTLDRESRKEFRVKLSKNVVELMGGVLYTAFQCELTPKDMANPPVFGDRVEIKFDVVDDFDENAKRAETVERYMMQAVDEDFSRGLCTDCVITMLHKDKEDSDADDEQ